MEAMSTAVFLSSGDAMARWTVRTVQTSKAVVSVAPLPGCPHGPPGSQATIRVLSLSSPAHGVDGLLFPLLHPKGIYQAPPTL